MVGSSSTGMSFGEEREPTFTFMHPAYFRPFVFDEDHLTIIYRSYYMGNWELCKKFFKLHYWAHKEITQPVQNEPIPTTSKSSTFNSKGEDPPYD